MRSVFCKLNQKKETLDIEIPKRDISLNLPSSDEYRNELKNMLINRQQHIQEVRRRSSTDIMRLEAIKETNDDEEPDKKAVGGSKGSPFKILTRNSTPPIQEIIPIIPIPKKIISRGRKPVTRPPPKD